jgi:hypothetical protein
MVEMTQNIRHFVQILLSLELCVCVCVCVCVCEEKSCSDGSGEICSSFAYYIVRLRKLINFVATLIVK